LARQLVDAELADRPMVIRSRGIAGAMTWRSFHGTAKSTFSEGDHPLHRVRYREQPEGLFLGSGTRQKCVSSSACGPWRGYGPPPPKPALRHPLPKCVSATLTTGRNAFRRGRSMTRKSGVPMRRISRRRAAAGDVTAIFCPPGGGRAFARLPAGFGRIARAATPLHEGADYGWQ
jgi:hypothetical protein